MNSAALSLIAKLSPSTNQQNSFYLFKSYQPDQERQLLSTKSKFM